MTKTTTTETTPNDAERTAIQRAERKLARANEILDLTLKFHSDRHADADISGLKVSPDELQALYDRQGDDQDRIAQIEAELEAAKAAPAARVERETLGATLMAKAQALDARISRWAEEGAALNVEAERTADAIIAEFKNPAHPGFVTLMTPFAGTKLVERLRHFSKETGLRGEIVRFADKLAAFRAIVNPKPAMVMPIRDHITVSYNREPLARSARAARDAAMRAKLALSEGENGVGVVAQR